MPHFTSINFCQNIDLKIQLFLPKKYKVFERWGACPQTPLPSNAGGIALQPPIVGKWEGVPPDPRNTPPPPIVHSLLRV